MYHELCFLKILKVIEHQHSLLPSRIILSIFSAVETTNDIIIYFDRNTLISST